MTTHRPNRTVPDRTAAERSITNMHDVLSDRERRYVLHALQEADEPVPLADLAAAHPDGEAGESLARDGGSDGPAREDAVGDGTDPAPAAGADGGPRDRVARLRDEHVVPMAEFGIVAYDPAADTVHLPDDVVVSVPAESL